MKSAAPARVMFASGLVLLAAVVSCNGAEPTDPMAGHHHAVTQSPSNVKYDSELASQVKAATARFNSKTQATLAGYAEASPCVANPSAGGMGFHWVNGDLVDPTFDPMNPEAVLYGPDGKLIAVEYIVINTGQTAPTFGGHPFDIGGAPIPVAHWTLHVWLYQQNSNGLFNPWNPDVVCS